MQIEQRGEAFGLGDRLAVGIDACGNFRVALERRAAAIPAYVAATSDYDAVIMPTTAIIAPRIDEVAKDDDYTRINLLILRNPMMFNILDCCSISIPMNRPGDVPTGLMVVGRGGADRRTLAISKAIEGVLHPM